MSEIESLKCQFCGTKLKLYEILHYKLIAYCEGCNSEFVITIEQKPIANPIIDKCEKNIKGA